MKISNTRRRLALLAGVMLASGAASAQAQSVNRFPERVCDVRDHGAGGTRIWFDTEGFQAAIDACAKAGGGTVRVTRGEYLIGPIWLKSNIRLELQKGAEVLAATDPALFPQGERAGLINVKDADNVAVVGEGLIDGQGAVWWERIRAIWRANPNFATDGQARQQQKDDRPRLILVSHSTNIRFEGVRIENSPSFHLVLNDTDHVTIDRVRITAPAHAPNTDAIDPIDSRHVVITNNVISVGDDIVAIKSNGPDPRHPDAVSSDILISGNTILAGRGICIGSGTSGGVTRVRVENNSFDGSMYGLRIKTMRGKGGKVRDVVFKNNRMKNVETPLVFTSYYEYRPLDLKAATALLQPGGFLLGNQIWPGPTDPAQPIAADKTPDMADIVVDGLTATGADLAGIVVGLPERPIAGLTLRDVRIEAKHGLLVRNAAISTSKAAITATDGTPYRLEAGATVAR
ncbi:endopolygalacturonase [Caulobacter sp. AP07]|uniref:glycoside hydrolase family 28 protein n=1 Tax=Caulobacter sp. AP07 TaxID=1144304 RepID=UPI0002720C92|nr:glycoside hydrolase family 28 protein [Caulobacter sp. AP07]EJL25254.1 endopolygalacturonase [Caulobacter sp. AP07]